MNPVAFGNLADPYAWLVRGLIEYNWEDLTITPHSYPQTKGRGDRCLATTESINRIWSKTHHLGIRL